MKMMIYIDDIDNDSSKDSECDVKSLREELANWAVVFNISCSATNELLKILRRISPDLPCDSRTLNWTPRDGDCVTMNGGEYIHYGIADCLTDFFEKYSFNEKAIYINVNIDGLPPFNNSRMQVWPILINIHKTNPVLIAGVFCGYSKPNDVNEYLNLFISELHTSVASNVINEERTFERRIVYKHEDSAPRTDDQFRNRVDAVHHNILH